MPVSRRGIQASLSALVLTVFGCAGEPGEAVDAVIVRDSAGIEIVTNRSFRQVDLPEWSVSAEPVLQIGSLEDPAYQLFGVRGALRLDDGRLVIVNGGSSQLRFYDKSGEHVGDVGGKGDGPGEFRALHGLTRTTSDSLVALGAPAKRVWYDPAGDFVRQDEIDVWNRYEPPFFAEATEVLADGSLLLMAHEAGGEPADGSYRPTFGMLRLMDDRATDDTIGWFPGGEYVRDGDDAYWVAYSGMAMNATGRDRVYVSSVAGLDIGEYLFDGTLVRRIRRNDPLEPVTDRDVELYRESLEEKLSSAPDDRGDWWRRQLENLTAADTRPAHGPMVVDRAGKLWVGDFDADRDADKYWTVFDRTGRQVARVMTPGRLWPLDIGEDYFLGVFRDDLDVAYIKLYELERR